MPVDKQNILDEIRRTARDNGGTPLGWRRFSLVTGIEQTVWIGKIWARWGDAVTEAGFTPNGLVQGYGDAKLLDILAGYVRELGRYPASNDLRLRAQKRDGFPASNTFQGMGTKNEVLAKLQAHLKDRPEWADVLAICEPHIKKEDSVPASGTNASAIQDGFVYLIRSGKRYKIGATNDLSRRSRAIAVQMPDPTNTVHVIRTDDPFGIEAYWHRRFETKRVNGEWFELDRTEVAAFKRRKTM